MSRRSHLICTCKQCTRDRKSARFPLPAPYRLAKVGHGKCVCCGVTFDDGKRKIPQKVLSGQNELKLLVKHRIIVPAVKSKAGKARCCAVHLDDADVLRDDTDCSATISAAIVPMDKATKCVKALLDSIQALSSTPRRSPHLNCNPGGNLKEEEYPLWTGWTKAEFDQMMPLLKDEATVKMRSSKNREIREALFIFWLKLRVDLSFNQIASLMDLPNVIDRNKGRCSMSTAFRRVLGQLKKGLVPEYLGFTHLTRKEMLRHHTPFSRRF